MAEPPAADVAATLVGSHRDFLGFLERRLGDRALAEDVLQGAFVKSIEKGGQLRDSESAVAWFYRMLRNAVADHARRNRTRERALAELARELDAAEPPPAVHEAVCACVSRLASSLKPEYAAALQRVDVEGVSVKAFAGEAAITSGNAGVRVFRAREALRKRVMAACGTCAEHGCLDCHCAAPA